MEYPVGGSQTRRHTCKESLQENIIGRGETESLKHGDFQSGCGGRGPASPEYVGFQILILPCQGGRGACPSPTSWLRSHRHKDPRECVLFHLYWGRKSSQAPAISCSYSLQLQEQRALPREIRWQEEKIPNRIAEEHDYLRGKWRKRSLQITENGCPPERVAWRKPREERLGHREGLWSAVTNEAWQRGGVATGDIRAVKRTWVRRKTFVERRGSSGTAA